MKLRHLCLFLLAILFASATGQNEDELHIPVENDNQFPPDNHSELDGNTIEGSGAGAIDLPDEVTTLPAVPLIEDVQVTSLNEDEQATTVKGDFICPNPCTCNTEGGSNNFVVDCSGSGLKEFPTPLDSKTTTLNVQNNMIEHIPKEVSALKNLKVLNAKNNSIMELALGSISELPELTNLNLANNRLVEYPTDLKNAFGLIKLEELDLGENDMRTASIILYHFTTINLGVQSNLN
ncbi:hypothetical protein O3G_MSEX007792 [Manduca sexta]|uniref:LRRNT domain-containing protein n=1 Tax=Manduca sexta TaxID=7130 RepID=A0A921Z895_MANSE|nr:hypothetical protein O3G_MSEX007792 [Manduca sexta]